MTTILTKVGRSIRALRKARNWSQEELAERADLHVNFIGGVERGERNLTLENLAKLSRGLKTPLSDIFALAESGNADEVRELAALLSATDAGIAEALREFVRTLNKRCAVLQGSRR